MHQYGLLLRSNNNTPVTGDGASLAAYKFRPDGAGDGTHAILTSWDVHIFTQITNFVYRADDGSGAYSGCGSVSKPKASVAAGRRKLRTSTKHLDEVACERSLFNLRHRHGSFGDGQIFGEVGQHILARDVFTRQGEYGVAGDSWEDHTIEGRSDEFVFCTMKSQ